MSFRQELFELRQTQQCWGYRPGWIWYQLQQKYKWFSLEELQLVADVLGYRPGWAFYQFKQWGPPPTVPSAPPAISHKFQQSLEMLELSLPIDELALKRAYRQRSLQAHPDAGGSHEAFLHINQAYEYLKGHLTIGGAV